MNKLDDVIELLSGTPQFRIKLSSQSEAPVYKYYGQQELENDLTDVKLSEENARKVRTMDEVNTLCEGDIVFSLISGRTTIVRKNHEGYMQTQNYIKLIPKGEVNKQYLVYLLNESTNIKKQWLTGLQGSSVIKYTIKHLKELELPKFPSIEKQEAIGDIYLGELKLEALKVRIAESERIIALSRLREVCENE